MLAKLRDEMTKRKQIEIQWNEANLRVTEYLDQVTSWKNNVIKQLDEQKTKNRDYLREIQTNSANEITALKDVIAKKDEEIKMKDQQVSQLTSSLSAKDAQIKSLLDQLQSQKLSTIAEMDGSHSQTSNSHDDSAVAMTYQAYVPEGPARFSSKHSNWMDFSSKAELILEASCFFSKPNFASFCLVTNSKLSAQYATVRYRMNW